IGASRFWSTVHATWTDQPVISRILSVNVGRKFVFTHSRTNSFWTRSVSTPSVKSSNCTPPNHWSNEAGDRPRVCSTALSKTALASCFGIVITATCRLLAGPASERPRVSERTRAKGAARFSQPPPGFPQGRVELPRTKTSYIPADILEKSIRFIPRAASSPQSTHRHRLWGRGTSHKRLLPRRIQAKLFPKRVRTDCGDSPNLF